MSLTKKIQLVAAAVGGLITAVVSALQVFGVLELTPEQNGAVGLVYTAAVAVVIAAAQALNKEEPNTY